MPKRPKPRVFQPLSRQELYELAWKEPMVRLAERCGVSSSYLARVYTELKVPRPDRGYWAKLEFGKSPPKPSLPAARPGDLMQWAPGTAVGSIVASACRSPISTLPHVGPKDHGKLHDLLNGARPLFLKTRKLENGILCPFKKTLVDILASESKLGDALETAQVLFLALNQKGFHVGMAAPDERASREQVFLPEKPAMYPRAAKWSPQRPTLVHINGTQIGLTLFEMTVDVEMVYAERGYLPVATLSQRQLERYTGTLHWRTMKPEPSGRLCLQAYCPHRLFKWSKQWRESKPGELQMLVPSIAEELEAFAPWLVSQTQEAQDLHDKKLRRWDEEERERNRLKKEEHQRKLLAESRADLLSAIAAWDEARRVRAFFDTVESELRDAPEQEAIALRERLRLATELLGTVDPFRVLRAWRSPSERS